MHILIADDEAPARGELRYLLGELAPDAEFSEAVTGQAVLDAVAVRPVDVVFLDINMPGISGLEAAASLLEREHPPLVVFATAYDRHAVRAFELAALDYVVKPYDEERLARTMERVRSVLGERERLAEQQAALRAYLSSVLPAAAPVRLWGERDTGARAPVDAQNILWIEAEAKKVHVQTRNGERLLLRYTLKELEGILPAHRFQRVHKAYVVNLDYVVEIAPFFSGTYVIRMADADRTEIPMSRRYAAQLKEKTGWR